MSGNERAAWLFGGVGLGLTLSGWLASQRRLSQAERDDPRGTAALAEEIDALLCDAVLEVDEASEAAYHDAVADLLESELDAEVEWEPSTPVGKPDLLVDDRVALELKFNPSKTEVDRCIGQVMGSPRSG